MRNHLQILTRSSIWAIRPEAALTAVLQIAGVQALGEWEAAKPYVQGKGTNKLAVIPIQGVLTNDGPAWLGSNYATIASAAEQAANDPSVKHVVLAVDSPGGEVTGCPETAAMLAALAKQKPVSAIVEGCSASAAYWLASQANTITLTPSGEVGSVGVRMMHADVSKMLETQGVKVTELHAGEFKTEWSPFAPLSEDAKADMQNRLDATHTDFVNAVATGRGPRASAEIKDRRFGEGRMFSSSEALNHGLVDSVKSAREFYRSVMPAQEDVTASPAFPIRARLEIARRR